MSWNRALAGCGLLAAIAVPQLGGAPLKVPFFTQKKYGCGAASAAMVLHYWSEALPGSRAAPSAAEVYRQLYREDLKGTRLSDVRRYLEEMGLRAFTFRAQWADVDEQLAKGRPIIVGLRPNPRKPMHFVVVVGVEAGRVRLNDPTRRKASQLPLDKFGEQWTLADRWMLLAAPLAPQ